MICSLFFSFLSSFCSIQNISRACAKFLSSGNPKTTNLKKQPVSLFYRMSEFFMLTSYSPIVSKYFIFCKFDRNNSVLINFRSNLNWTTDVILPWLSEKTQNHLEVWTRNEIRHYNKFVVAANFNNKILHGHPTVKRF